MSHQMTALNNNTRKNTKNHTLRTIKHNLNTPFLPRDLFLAISSEIIHFSQDRAPGDPRRPHARLEEHLDDLSPILFSHRRVPLQLGPREHRESRERRGRQGVACHLRVEGVQDEVGEESEKSLWRVTEERGWEGGREATGLEDQEAVDDAGWGGGDLCSDASENLCLSDMPSNLWCFYFNLHQYGCHSLTYALKN